MKRVKLQQRQHTVLLSDDELVRISEALRYYLATEAYKGNEYALVDKEEYYWDIQQDINRLQINDFTS